MVLGGIIAAAVAVAVYFLSKFVVATQRERVSISFLFAGATCLANAGFLVNAALGYLAIGLLCLFFSVVLGYEAGE